MFVGGRHIRRVCILVSSVKALPALLADIIRPWLCRGPGGNGGSGNNSRYE
jgi:hypothetical protein